MIGMLEKQLYFRGGAIYHTELGMAAELPIA
jgi:hypothetical protein